MSSANKSAASIAGKWPPRVELRPVLDPTSRVQHRLDRVVAGEDGDPRGRAGRRILAPSHRGPAGRPSRGRSSCPRRCRGPTIRHALVNQATLTVVGVRLVRRPRPGSTPLGRSTRGTSPRSRPAGRPVSRSAAGQRLRSGRLEVQVAESFGLELVEPLRPVPIGTGQWGRVDWWAEGHRRRRPGQVHPPADGPRRPGRASRPRLPRRPCPGRRTAHSRGESSASPMPAPLGTVAPTCIGHGGGEAVSRQRRGDQVEGVGGVPPVAARIGEGPDQVRGLER